MPEQQERKKYISVRVAADDYEKLRQIAEESNRSITDCCAVAVHNWIAGQDGGYAVPIFHIKELLQDAIDKGTVDKKTAKQAMEHIENAIIESTVNSYAETVSSDTLRLAAQALSLPIDMLLTHTPDFFPVTRDRDARIASVPTTIYTLPTRFHAETSMDTSKFEEYAANIRKRHPATIRDVLIETDNNGKDVTVFIQAYQQNQTLSKIRQQFAVLAMEQGNISMEMLPSTTQTVYR